MRKSAIAAAVSGAIVLGGCIPFSVDPESRELTVVNETTDAMSGLALPSSSGFEIRPAGDRGHGFGRLPIGSGDCKIKKLELYRVGEEEPVATIKSDRLCDDAVVYRGPDDITIRDD